MIIKILAVVTVAAVGYVTGLTRGYHYGKASGRAELTIELMEKASSSNAAKEDIMRQLS